MKRSLTSSSLILASGPFFAGLLLLLALEVVAYEEQSARHALIIANQDYPRAPLKNPLNDGLAVSEQLLAMGLEVTTVFNASGSQMDRAISAFYDGLPPEVVALVYYAGHAIQVNYRNYLVPVDVTFGDPAAFMAGLYDINRLLEQIPDGGGVQSVIILDACRDNPFGEAAAADGVIADGLAPLRAPANTLIAYATEPGSVASDGDGENGIYTKHLLRHIDKQLSVEALFKKVRRGVARETRKRQIPWEHSSLVQDVYIDAPSNRQVPDLLGF